MLVTTSLLLRMKRHYHQLGTFPIQMSYTRKGIILALFNIKGPKVAILKESHYVKYFNILKGHNDALFKINIFKRNFQIYVS